MPPKRKSGSDAERARRWLSSGRVARDDSDDELGYDDLPWEWIYEQDDDEDSALQISKKRKRESDDARIIGARMGSFKCQVGDTVLLKAADNQAWVGIICEFGDDEDGEKSANFMWFSSPAEIRNKQKKRTDFFWNELYISPSWDWNPLSSINGMAHIFSPKKFNEKYPKGSIPTNSPARGKVFVCRRGCNTRTATYTSEFAWEGMYQNAQDLPNLVDVVEKETKATRKPRTKAVDDDDFVVKDDVEPRTPRKKRKHSEVTTPKSNRKNLTPRKFITPTHKRIVLKKALEITPLGTRILSPNALASPYQLARNQLHVSTVPAALPCREEEFSEVYQQLEKAITDGTGSCIYIAGTPGTGKTATVREVVAQLNAAVVADELDDFIFVEINGMKLTDPHQAYSLLWEALRGDRVSPAHALDLLSREFSTPSPRRVPCVVLMDELDQLVTRTQSVMYNFFNWPAQRHSRLIVLAVANTMDLPERTLSNKISSRLGLHRITFAGYTHEQLMHIIQSRLAGVPGNVVHPDAVQFAARKVAAVSGDARRALDICRRAVEIAEAQALLGDEDAGEENVPPATPSKSGRGKKAANASPAKKVRQQPLVTIATIKQAITEATSSPLQRYLKSLPLAAKVFLAGFLARIRRTGLVEALVGDVLDESRRLCLLAGQDTIRETLLLETKDDGYMAGVPRQGMRSKSAGLAPRMVGMEDALLCLTAAGILGAESRKGERCRRIRLLVGDEEVSLAFKEDDEVRGLGVGS